MTADKVIDLLRREVLKAGGVSVWSEKNGLDQGNVSRALTAHRMPSPSLLNALGLERVVSYRRKEK